MTLRKPCLLVIYIIPPNSELSFQYQIELSNTSSVIDLVHISGYSKKLMQIIDYICFYHYCSRGRISYFTHPPETHTLPTHVSAEIVAEMGKAFDWDELEKGNEEALAGTIVLQLL